MVQASLLGSVLSNLLLVLGFCFFFGGLRFKEQHFNQSAAMTSGSLLSISVLSLLIPAAFYAQLSSENDPRRDEKVLNLSRGTAVVLFAIYVSYLVFQLYTHTHLYQDSESNGRREPEPRVGTGPMLTVSDDRTGRALRKPTSADMNSTLRRRVSSPSFPAPSPSHPGSNIDEAGEEEEASMNTPSAAVLLLLSTIIVAVCAEYLVGSIEGLSKEWGLSEGFVGLILLWVINYKLFASNAR